MMDLDPCVTGPLDLGQNAGCVLHPPNPAPPPRLSDPLRAVLPQHRPEPLDAGLDLGQPCIQLRQHLPRVSSLNELLASFSSVSAPGHFAKQPTS